MIEDERADHELSTNDSAFDKTFQSIEIALGSNMAACFLAQQNHKDAEKCCSKVKANHTGVNYIVRLLN
jgi:hypothetical protein